MIKTIPPINNILEKIYKDRLIRASVSEKSHQWFFHIYFGNYVKYQTAPFQQEILKLTEDQTLPLVAIMAFRGSGKSTIVTCSTAIWSVLGSPNKKYVVILTKTQQQARQHLANIRYEFENNELLKNDFGPFEDKNSEWTTSSLTLPKYGAKIIAVSAEQGIRGLRHREYRPDLLLVDDVEDDQSVRNKDSRDKTYDWFVREVIPIGDENTKIIVVGNLLHRDSLMMRIKNDIDKNNREGIFKSYPIINDDKVISWPAKFPSPKEIEDLRLKIGDEKAWKQEYVLKIVYDDTRVIRPEWIQYYDKITEHEDSLRYNAIGVDPAISESTYADYTGIVSAKVYGNRENLRIYIIPNLINQKMNFPKSVETIKNLYKIMSHGETTKVFVESVAMQGAVAQTLNHEGIPAEEIRIKGDKRARLSVLGGNIQKGQILFPKVGAEELINQMIDLGTHGHDDLADAFSLLCNKLIEEDENFTMPDLYIL
jgi:predicted phage terminase large subunit-like protein